MNIKLNWTHFVNVSDVPEQPGVYLFCLADFDYNPFYIGTAGEGKASSLRTRLQENEKKFSSGKSTFLRPSFFNMSRTQNFTFLDCWKTATQDSFRDYVFVPGDNNFISNEAMEFWQTRLFKFYAVADDANDRQYLRAIESKLQSVAHGFYGHADLKIPSTRSFLLGQQNMTDIINSREITLENIDRSKKIGFLNR